MAKESFKAGEHKIWAMSRLMFKSAKRASLIENLRSLRGPVHGVAFLAWNQHPRACTLKASDAAPPISTMIGTSRGKQPTLGYGHDLPGRRMPHPNRARSRQLHDAEDMAHNLIRKSAKDKDSLRLKRKTAAWGRRLSRKSRRSLSFSPNSL
jgi:hypothetical protein